MKNPNDVAQELQKPNLQDGTAGTQQQNEADRPLDAVAVKKPSDQEPDHRQANMVLAERLDTFDPSLANALRLCADGLLNCNRRICTKCSRARTTRLSSSYRVRLDRMIRPHHLTLTGYPVDLTRAALAEVRARFKLLRKRMKVEPTINVVGGVANIEIDVAHDGLGWLIGIHAVIDAPGAPSENWIRQAWQDLGGGQQVRLDPIVRGTQVQTFGYSTKVSALPASLPMLQQFISETKGFRAMTPFGSVHPLSGKSPRRRAPVAPASPMASTVITAPAATAQEPASLAEVRS